MQSLVEQGGDKINKDNNGNYGLCWIYQQYNHALEEKISKLLQVAAVTHATTTHMDRQIKAMLEEFLQERPSDRKYQVTARTVLFTASILTAFGYDKLQWTE